MAHKPLDGVKVLDLSRALAGPYCTALLADLGAEIVKVESSKGGDVTRTWPPFENEHSLYFDSINRGKESLAIDFYSAEGRALLRELAMKCDVVVENFKSGVMAELGLEPDELRKAKPTLVVASISGFGEVGPLANAAGLDQVAQAMSGLMSITGPNKDEIYRFGIPIIDIVSGVFCALGVVAAIAGRELQGVGALVSTSLLESALAISVFQGQRYLSTGQVPTPTGNDHPSITPYGVFEANDGPLIIAVGNEKQWTQLCDLLGKPGLAQEEHFSTGRNRTQHRDLLKTELELLLAGKTALEWTEIIRNSGIPAGPIYSYNQVFEDDQVQALKMVQSLTRLDGSKLPLLRGPLSINHEPTPIEFAPPELGADSARILSRFGYSDDRIRDLAANGIILQAAHSKAAI